MSEWGQVRGFLFYSTLPAQWTVYEPQQVKVSSQGVASSKKASHSPGLSPINLLKPNDIYIYMSYHSANLQTLHFKYLFNKYTYWIF